MPIYISRDLYLSGDFAVDPNAPRIGYKDLIGSGSASADFEEANYPATNIQNVSTGNYWRSTDDTTTQYVEFQVSPTTINYFAIAGHNLAGAQLTVQRRDDPADPWENVTDPVIPGDNHAIMWAFLPVVSSGFWRLEIVPVEGNFPRIAVAYLGEYLTLERRMYVGHQPSNYAVTSNVTSNMSESGQFLGRVVRNQSLDMNPPTFSNVTPAFWRSYIEPFARSAVTRPFFFAWRPAQYPLEIAFGWVTDPAGIRMTNQSPNGDVEFSIRGKALAPLL